MSKFTERVEHDLSQIADRATPSSTAWESIQRRIAEQDSESTMEVIMLNPDPKKPSAVSRTWMAAAAALVLIVGIAGLAAVLNRDDGGDTDTVDEPDVTVPLELDDNEEPDVLVPDETTDVVVPDDELESSSGVVEPEGPIALTGFAVGNCTFGSADLDLDDRKFSTTQSCTYRDTNEVPFEAVQEYVYTRHDDLAFIDGGLNPYTPTTGLSDSGFMYAGYQWDGGFAPSYNTRFVGVAEGVGSYAGMLIYFSGSTFGTTGPVHLQWATEDELSSLQINGTDVEAEEVTSDCAITGFVEDTDGDPLTEQFTTLCSGQDGTGEERNTYLFGTEANTLGIGSYRYAVTTGSSMNSGILPRDGGAALSVGILEGTGDSDGLLLHQLSIGTVTPAGELDTTTVQVALPPAE